MSNELTLHQLQELVARANVRIQQELFPAVRELSLAPVDPLPSFPNRTASACLESLEKLAALHKRFTTFLEANQVGFGEEQRIRLDNALAELGLEYPEAEA